MTADKTARAWSGNHEPWWAMYRHKGTTFTHSPSATVGTHDLAIRYGARVDQRWSLFSDKRFFRPGVALDVVASGHGYYYGDHGPVAGLTIEQTFSLGFGDSRCATKTFFFAPAHGLLNFQFLHTTYLTTDETSQFTGTYVVEVVHRKSRVRFTLENDYYATAPFHTDKYRTGAGKVSYCFMGEKHLVGASVFIADWTWDWMNYETIVASNPMYRRQSHGIAGVSFLFDFCELAIGWDSETVRDLTQNTIHRAAKYYVVPMQPRPDRFFLQLSLFSRERIY